MDDMGEALMFPIPSGTVRSSGTARRAGRPEIQRCSLRCSQPESTPRMRPELKGPVDHAESSHHAVALLTAGLRARRHRGPCSTAGTYGALTVTATGAGCGTRCPTAASRGSGWAIRTPPSSVPSR